MPQAAPQKTDEGVALFGNVTPSPASLHSRRLGLVSGAALVQVVRPKGLISCMAECDAFFGSAEQCQAIIGHCLQLFHTRCLPT